MSLALGAIGFGGLGHLMLNIYDDMDDVDVVAGADTSAGARDLFENEFGAPAYENYRTMLKEHGDALDAVTIVTPHTLHYEQAMACLERDLHVLLEKPMVTNVREAVDLVDAAADRDVVLQVGYQRHFHPAFREMRRVVGSGRIGDLHAFDAYLGQDWITPHSGTWRVKPALSGGGQLYDTGSHLLDALIWTTDTRPRSVAAQMDFAEPRVDVNSALALVMARDDDSVTGSVTVSGDGVAIDPQEGYIYWGTDGRLSYVDGEITVAEKGAVTYTTEISTGTDFHTLTRQKLENFVASTRGEVEPAVSGEYGLLVTALTEAAYSAATGGETVDVGQLIDEARAGRD